ncbi:glutamyl-tRNA reductase [Fulvivirga sp. M361]|uniref:glutamyl-tRNA reductase n=1 Tax=Fulvivirga sp. M361 TaxID=2594266 RepID=UPI00117A54E8|nr:glutamyl-tRNA reductase [Fulvivirga sp. M361]TRX59396.1 glutamyl-tRNA reductase [Fulvivirga sp. M361]
MVNSFRFVGVSFKNTPLEVREKLALDESLVKKLLVFLRDFSEASDVLVLSTCNRTEIYYSHDSDLSNEILKGLCLLRGVEYNDLTDYFHTSENNTEAVRRLFNVALGLEAQVIGDMQIINQVKNAYQWSADEDMAGPFLHRLMHTIFFTNKRVVQETPFRDGAASVSYAAKELIEEITTDIVDPKVLILGLGEIGEDVCKNFVGSAYEVVVANRTLSKAQMIAAECGFKVISFENATEQIQHADVIISSISMDKPFITKEMIDAIDLHSFKFFIDLSVPRSVDMNIESIPGALVYNIDNIQNKASEALDKRISAIPMVRNIIEEAIVDFQDWSKEMIVSPTIKKLKNALEEIRKEELERYLKDASEQESKMVDKVTKSIMQKVMKLPVLQLKAACKRGEAETLIDVLNDLFDLEKQSVEIKK